MTALAGIWRLDGRPDAHDACARMLAPQAMYGSLGAVPWSDGPVALGRGLYRLLPEDVHDEGPQIAANGNLALVADVRLDNRAEMLSALHIAPVEGRALCDAAILLAGFARWDEGVLERLYGDYAFAVFDRRRGRLVMARDFMGQRPLHFHRGKGFVALASMPRGLHALPEIPYAPDEQRVAEFLAVMPETGTQSFFTGIERVPAGHVAVVTASGISIRKHWRPARNTVCFAKPDDYVHALREKMDEAVRVRLRGAGKTIASQLSGGLDSAVVTATAARLTAGTEGRIVALTGVPRAGYDGPVPPGSFADEGPHAAITAAAYGNIEHLCVRDGEQSPLAPLDRYFFLFQQPMMNLCNGGWVIAIYEAIRARGLHVMLHAPMGNLSISYNGVERLGELFAAGHWLTLARESRALVRRNNMRWRNVASAVMGPFLPAALWKRLLPLFGKTPPDPLRYTALRADRFAKLDLQRLARERDLDFSYRPRADGFATRLWALQRTDLGNFNKGVLGGWGIDQRDPTADRAVIEFCLGLPMDQFLSEGQPRALLRKTFGDRVPQTVLLERRRGLQGADWHERFAAARDAAREEIERLEACGAASATLDLPRLRKLIESWPEGGWDTEAVVHSYRLALLRGLSAGHFLRRATRSNQ